MNTERFEIRNSLEANYLCLELEEPFELDDIAMRVLKRDCPDFLLPYQTKEVNDRLLFSYVLNNDIALEYSMLVLPKASVIRLYTSLLEPFINGADWFLDYHYLCIDRRYVYMNRAGDKAHFVYVPEKSFCNTDAEILDFFKKLFFDTQVTDDKDFQLRLYQYFNSDHVTIGGFYKIIREYPLSDRRRGSFAQEQAPHSAVVERPVMPQTPQPQIVQPQTPPPVAVQTQPQTPQPVSESKPVDEMDAIMKMFGDSKKTKPAKPPKAPKPEKPAKTTKEKSGGFNLGGLFHKEHKAEAPAVAAPPGGQPVNVVPQQPVSNGMSYETQIPESYSDETEVFAGNVNLSGPYLELVQSPLEGAPRMVSLEFPGQYIVLGRMSNDEVKPDVAFPSEFKRIGRRHLRIEKTANGYCVIDLGSVNHTLINGRVLQPSQPYPLQNMMMIQLTESQPIQYRVHL